MAEFAYIDARGQKWVLPDWAAVPDPGTRASACRSCAAPVLWVDTYGGKRAPLNADGTSHFATCPQADQWRRKP